MTNREILRSMPRCDVSADGKTIDFDLATEVGMYSFSVHPQGLTEIAMRLVGAHGEANARATQGWVADPMIVGPYSVGGDSTQGRVLLSLSPAPNARFDFGLSPQAAKRIGEALIRAAATLSAPQASTKPN